MHILPGTHIISDGCAAYTRLAEYGYTHSRVIHERNFVSPSNFNVHTQNVESLWSVIKRMLRKTGTNLKARLDLHIREKMFRYTHKDAFLKEFIKLVNEKYKF